MNISTTNYSNQQTNQQWVDIESPSKEDFEKIAREYDLPLTELEDCLNPKYLPQIKTHGAAQFAVIRIPETHLPIEADTIQELTTKVVFFITQRGLFSLHRAPLDLIKKVQADFTEVIEQEKNTALILSLFMGEVSELLMVELNALDQKTESFEQNIFMIKRSRSILQEGYYIKRKASAYRKVIKTTIEVCQKLTIQLNCPVKQMQESMDQLSHCLFLAEDTYENVQALLNLHMAIQSQKINEASYKTNETVRILTIFTLFFLPLNFITGVFGMNFEHIPWLKHVDGFYFSIGLMIALVIGFTYYLFYKGWLSAEKAK